MRMFDNGRHLQGIRNPFQLSPKQRGDINTKELHERYDYKESLVIVAHDTLQCEKTYVLQFEFHSIEDIFLVLKRQILTTDLSQTNKPQAQLTQQAQSNRRLAQIEVFIFSFPSENPMGSHIKPHIFLKFRKCNHVGIVFIGVLFTTTLLFVVTEWQDLWRGPSRVPFIPKHQRVKTTAFRFET